MVENNAADFDANAEARSRIPIFALGMGLGLFFALTFTACVLWDIWVPSQAMHAAWAPLLPWFTWISWPAYFIGLVETFTYGWWGALIFAPLYNLFAARRRFGRGSRI